MATKSGWTGWIGFAGCLLVVIGGIDFFEGMIAAIRGSYYAVTPNQIVVFDLTTWGWLTLIWGIILVLVGFGLLAGAGWARWTAIVALSLNFFQQLVLAVGPRHVKRDVALVAVGALAAAAADAVRAVVLGVDHPVVHLVVGVDLPTEQVGVVALQLVAVLADALEVDSRLAHGGSFL